MTPGRRLLRRLGASEDPLQQPLLSREELLETWHRAQARRGQPRPHTVEVQRGLAGEARAATLGRGLDYEDSRAYQPGDDLRFMNWRLSARTGDMHMKVFREEHRPALVILLDRRATMRFGTRGQLKAAAAARLAIHAVFEATQIPMAVGGLVLDPQPRWYAPRPGSVPAWELAQAASAPCPPLEADGKDLPLGRELKLLSAHLTRGSAVLLLSDFQDLQAEDRHALVQLGADHEVRAVCIFDPAEGDLPAAGRLPLTNASGTAHALVDTGDTGLRAAFHDASARRADEQAQWFRAAGIEFHTLRTDENVAAFADTLRALDPRAR